MEYQKNPFVLRFSKNLVSCHTNYEKNGSRVFLIIIKIENYL